MDSLIKTDLFGDRDFTKIAISRLQTFEQTAIKMNPAGYWVAISGGKDSAVIYNLVKRSGVRAVYHHSLTTVDAPETVRHIREHYPDVKITRPKVPLLQKIPLMRTAPPMRLGRRWCCRDYKEHGGTGHFVVTGVRAAESARRNGYRLIENCMRAKTKRFLHVIIDWSDDDVWDYTHQNNLPINPLYLPPYNCKRVGCVLCPLALPGIESEARRLWPKMVLHWEKAIKQWFINHGTECCDISFIKTPDDYWKWWLSGGVGNSENEDQENLIFEELKDE